VQDRLDYYSWIPRVGLWDEPVRKSQDNTCVDSYERRLRLRAWETVSDQHFDQALQEIEQGFPKVSVKTNAPQNKSIAVVASSHGAQWQELIDWALGMLDAGYNLQIFTPFGRPVAFQRDSMLVREPPTEAVAVSLGLPGVGLGCPLRLDPLRLPQDRLHKLLGNAVGADQFDPSQFGAVYLAGGLGFNEDIAVTSPRSANDTIHANITPTPHALQMLNHTVENRLPIIALCHGPTLLASLDVEINGRREKLVKGIEVAALPALEPMVHAQGKLEPQFSFYTWKTHDVLAEAGAIVDAQTDLKDMTVVKTGVRDGLHIATGPGPQAARNLVKATISAMNSTKRI
jgi:putative intracellular protease/amidase